MCARFVLSESTMDSNYLGGQKTGIYLPEDIPDL